MTIQRLQKLIIGTIWLLSQKLHLHRILNTKPKLTLTVGLFQPIRLTSRLLWMTVHKFFLFLNSIYLDGEDLFVSREDFSCCSSAWSISTIFDFWKPLRAAISKSRTAFEDTNCFFMVLFINLNVFVSVTDFSEFLPWWLMAFSRAWQILMFPIFSNNV